MDTLNVACHIAESGLVVHELPEGNKVIIARPASLEGTSFRGCSENRVTGYAETILLVNAPLAELQEIGSKKTKKYNLNISLAAAPGPGPIWIDEDFEDIKTAIKAVIECFFGDRVDFNNESLNSWYS